MARRNSDPLTEREAQIMDVVWRFSEVTAEQVRERLPGSPHDSTVRTLLRILETKGYLTHQTKGKAYVYRAAVGRQKAQRLAVRSMLTRFFAGSAENLVLRLIEDEQLSQEQLDQLRRSPTLAAGRKRRRKGETS
ncbi:MAG: BlaI/MecI/CopY family transcriptional regulator [Isosphaeraceae bacterium]